MVANAINVNFQVCKYWSIFISFVASNIVYFNRLELFLLLNSKYFLSLAIIKLFNLVAFVSRSDVRNRPIRLANTSIGGRTVRHFT